jgi:Bacterial regulatory protein, Fis family
MTANSAKRGFGTVQLTTMRTSRFEPHPAAVAKDRIRQILALTLRANHNGNQSQLGRIVPDSFKPGLSVHSEGSKQCIVPGYGKSKLKDCYINANCLSNRPGNARQLENEIKRLVASVRRKSITEDHLDASICNLSASIQTFQPKEEPAPKSPTSQSLPDAEEQLERRLIEEALRNSGGNKQKAAQVLGLSRQGLIKKLKRHSINQ